MLLEGFVWNNNNIHKSLLRFLLVRFWGEINNGVLLVQSLTLLVSVMTRHREVALTRYYVTMMLTTFQELFKHIRICKSVLVQTYIPEKTSYVKILSKNIHLKTLYKSCKTSCKNSSKNPPKIVQQSSNNHPQKYFKNQPPKSSTYRNTSYLKNPKYHKSE